MSAYYTNVVNKIAAEHGIGEKAARALRQLVESANAGGLAEGRRESTSVRTPQRSPEREQEFRDARERWNKLTDEQQLAALQERLRGEDEEQKKTTRMHIRLIEDDILRKQRKAEGRCVWCGAKPGASE